MRFYQNPEFILQMKIPEYIFGGARFDATTTVGIKAPQCPVLAFINSKSGGQLGAELLKSYQVLLSPHQVFDLSKEKPDKVLHLFFSGLKKLKADGDKVAESIQSSLRIIVAGGDGTAGWLLGVIGDLELSYPPPIATVPMGTGNNLPYSFGWGKKNPGTDLEAAKKFLFKVYGAKPINIDSWHIVMKVATPTQSLEPVKKPHSLHRVSDSDALHEAGTQVFRGGFWNYFSIGMDAQVAYEFHKKRQEHPEMFKNQLMNQGAYAMIGVTQGWFFSNVVHPSLRNINQVANIYIKRKSEHDWKKLNVPKRIRSVVMLNLPSFSGGLNPWGTPSNEKSSKAHKVRIEFHKGSASETYMRIDGEPWLQPLPDDDNAETVAEITNVGQAVMLGTTSKCMSQCVPHGGGKVDPSLDKLCSPPTSTIGGEPEIVESYEELDSGSCS